MLSQSYKLFFFTSWCYRRLTATLKTANMPSIKLHYFNTEGRAEIIRLIFAAGGVDFEDDRIERKNWTALKSGKSICLPLFYDLS